MISKRKVEKLLENAGRGVERFVCRQLKKLPRITTNPIPEFPPRLRTEGGNPPAFTTARLTGANIGAASTVISDHEQTNVVYTRILLSHSE